MNRMRDGKETKNQKGLKDGIKTEWKANIRKKQENEARERSERKRQEMRMKVGWQRD